MKNNIRLLTFAGYYYPGYKAGGPVKTLKSMVDALCSDYDFWVVTRDRDLGDSESYSNLQKDCWVEQNGANVYYSSPKSLSFFSFVNVVKSLDYDVLYLNSFFDVDFTIKVLLARRLGLLKKGPVVLAPRGEFSSAALALKSLKKSAYIKLFCLLGLHRSVTWQASSELEAEDICRALPLPGSSVFVAKDLPGVFNEVNTSAISSIGSGLRLVFLSRISPMKNLDFALKALALVRAPVHFDIYGPIEDQSYWQSCKALIKSLPKNVNVQYQGVAAPNQVGSIFAKYDMFFFPTRGENYGHVIAESLAAGTRVLLSDQTPWANLEADGLGWNFNLHSVEPFADVIQRVAGLSIDERMSVRQNVLLASHSRINNAADLLANKTLFKHAIERFCDAS